MKPGDKIKVFWGGKMIDAIFVSYDGQVLRVR
jgi:hypothetical protein